MIRNGKIVTKFLRYDFSEEDRKVMANDLAEAVNEKVNAEADLKAVRDQFKSRISEAEARISRFARALRSGFEMRDIECRVDYDFEKRLVRYIRSDNGELGETRQMLEHELQLEMELTGKGVDSDDDNAGGMGQDTEES